jgi:hypothetical protein
MSGPGTLDASLSPETAPALRRQFALPDEDVEYLEALGLPWETILVGAVCWVLVHTFPLPSGFTSAKVTIAVRIVANYPGAALDMIYVFPPLSRADGKAIPSLSAFALDGKTFQQWSRHYTATNPWRVGIHTLGSHMHAAEEWLARAVV